MSRPTIRKPGFYPDISCDEYFAEPCPAPALTNSGIRTLLNSCPAKFAHEHPAIGQPEEERKATAAMHMGSLVHRLALGKGSDYAMIDAPDFRTKDAREARADAEENGLIPVLAHKLAEAETMAAVIREAIERQTAGHEYHTEVVMAWQRTVGDFAFWCRGMIDVWCPTLNLALDVKTIADAGDKSIIRAFATGYAGQDAWYRSGVEAIGGDYGRTRFGFLFVEKTAPFLFRDAEADEAFRYGAELTNDRAAAIFARCLKSGEWPSYRPIIATPPPWWLGDLTTTDDETTTYEEAA